MILECKLEAGFDRLRSTGHEHHMLETAAAVRSNYRGQLFESVAGEVVAIAVGDAFKLPGDRGVYFLIAVADAIDGGTRRAVDILLPRRVPHIAAAAIGDLRKARSRNGDAGKDVCTGNWRPPYRRNIKDRN